MRDYTPLFNMDVITNPWPYPDVNKKKAQAKWIKWESGMNLHWLYHKNVLHFDNHAMK